MTSSIRSTSVMPSIRSMYSTLPARSVMIGRVYGSHSASFCAARHLLALVDQQPRAVRHAEARALALLVVDQHDLAVARHHHRHALAVHHHVAVLHRDRAFVARLHARLLGAALRRAADVEGAHGQLRARLADRLRGDHADRLADVHRRAAGEVAPVAMAADADRDCRRSAPSGSSPPRRRRVSIRSAAPPRSACCPARSPRW